MKKIILIFVTFFYAGFNTLLISQTLNFTWAKSFGSTENDNVNCVVIDASSNIYIGGNFYSSSISFGSATLNNSGGNYGGGVAPDFYIAKLDPYGTPIWATKGGASNAFEQVSSIAVSSAGNCYVTGLYTASMSIGSTNLTNSGGYDAFVAKYDANGNPLWAKKIGNNGNEMGFGIATDASDNCYVIGTFTSNSIFTGSNTLTKSGMGGDVFIVKYNSSGNIQWTRKIGGSSDDNGNAITIDANGNIYLLGGFTSSSVTIGQTTLNNSGSNDIFVAKYNSSGTPQWAIKGGGDDNDSGYGIATDANGNCFILGFFSGNTFNMGTYSVSNTGASGTTDILFAKINNNGVVQWLKKCGSNDIDYPGGIALDPSGNVFLTGYFASNSINLGGSNIINNTSFTYYSDVFIAKYDNNGNFQWAKNSNGSLNEDGWSLAAKSATEVVMVGTFNSDPVTFGQHALSTNGKVDIYVTKLTLSASVDEMLKNTSNIIVYPNPAFDIINIIFPYKNEDITMYIYNSMGQLMAEQIVNKNNFAKIDIHKWNKGLYNLVIRNKDNQCYYKKIIKN